MSTITGFNAGGNTYNSMADNSPLHMCPKCQGYTDKRIANSKWVNKMFFWMSLRKYQCQHCDHRFYILAR